MGNIAVDVFKNINFNKLVDKEIFKNVDVNVDIENPLAESEADAEAFGPNPLAQTDTFAYVNQEGGMIEEFLSDGQVDAVGNASIEIDDVNTNGVLDQGDLVTITYEDVDDINGILHWAELSSPPPATPDAPVDSSSFTLSNKIIEVGAELLPGEFEGTLVGGDVVGSDHIIDFGQRILPSYGLYAGPHNFDITVPVGSPYLIEVDSTTIEELNEIEVEYDITVAEPPSVLINFGPENENVPTELYTQEAAELGALGEWNFDVAGTLTGADHSGGDQEAFAYSESTAALDLDPFIIEPEPEV